MHGCPGCGGPAPQHGVPQPVSLQALTEAIRAAPVPLLVEFWAPDCGPCVASTLVLDAVGHRLAGEAVVLRVDVEEAPEACEAYGILAVPTVVLFSGGRDRGHRVGLPKAREIEAWVHGVGTA